MKYLLSALLSCVIAVSGYAQVQFGIKAGANFAKFIGTGIHTAIVPGFQGGGLVAIPIATLFSLQPEVNYSTQGSKAPDNGYAHILKETYINIPLLLKYRLASGFFAETGPQIGFLISANVSGGPGSGDVTSAYRSADLSWAIGLGYFFKAVNAGIDARYNIDFTNDVPSNYGTGGSTYNSVIQVGVFYIFGRGK